MEQALFRVGHKKRLPFLFDARGGMGNCDCHGKLRRANMGNSAVLWNKEWAVAGTTSGSPFLAETEDGFPAEDEN